MSPAIFYQLLLCAVILAVYLFIIQMNALFSLATFVSIQGILSVLGPTYIYCMLSENVTIKLYDIGDCFYEFGWYRLPIKQQKLFLLPIQRSQSEFRMMGLGLVDCSLGVFSAVCVYFTGKPMEDQQNHLFVTDYPKDILVFHPDADLQIKIGMCLSMEMHY